jgi:phosphoribosylformimino-5-aminoimidazole carboxamide ribotide isomerase
MILLPAVDIRGGRAVRLRQGQFDDETVYADDPLEAARRFVEAGARFLHVVDLDGARDGQPTSLEQLERLVSGVRVPVQYGGGLRSLGAIKAALAAGAGWVVVGTAAYTDTDFLREAVQAYGPRLIVAVDVREGKVSLSGWTEQTEMSPEELIERLHGQGVTKFIYTNADRDGMLEGVGLDEVRRISEVIRGRFIVSGGVGSLDDLRALRDLKLGNLTGVIVGKALYEGRFTVAEAQAELGAPPHSPG